MSYSVVDKQCGHVQFVDDGQQCDAVPWRCAEAMHKNDPRIIPAIELPRVQGPEWSSVFDFPVFDPKGEERVFRVDVPRQFGRHRLPQITFHDSHPPRDESVSFGNHSSDFSETAVPGQTPIAGAIKPVVIGFTLESNETFTCRRCGQVVIDLVVDYSQPFVGENVRVVPRHGQIYD